MAASTAAPIAASSRPARPSTQGTTVLLVAGMADADPQAMEFTVSEQANGVAQAVLAAVAAIELEPRDARRKIQFVVCNEQLLRLDLPGTATRR